MAPEPSVTVIVLAGGMGTRLGGNKLALRIGDKTLLERVLHCAMQLSDDVLLSVAQRQVVGHSQSLTARIVTDIYPGKGALGGMHAGLTASSRLHHIVVAADMPFVNQNLLRSMVNLLGDYDAIVPKVDDKVHPLHAVYHKRCLLVIQDQIEKGDLRVMNLLERLKVRYVTEKDVNRFDPQHLSFFNINTQADLQRARELATHREDNVT